MHAIQDYKGLVEHSRNSCYTYFRISGDFDPDRVTELLGLTPDTAWKKDDLRRDGNPYGFASWTFGRCADYEIQVENQMRKTIAPLLDKVDLLNQIRRENDVVLALEVVPTLYAGEITPCISPTLDVMDFCCITRTEIDLDLYVYSDTD